MTTLVLSIDDIRGIVKSVGLNRLMDTFIERLHNALYSFDPKETIIPPRDGFHYTNPTTGLIEWMPVMRRGDGATIKVVGYHPRNPSEVHLPTIIGTISSYDTRTGHLVGIADGTFLTALRTGAASAVATRLLASKSARTIGLIGLGAQAIAQLHALSRVVDVREVLVFDNDASAVETFPERIAVLDLDVSVKALPMIDIVPSCDVLVTATSIGVGEGPLFEPIKVKPWLHINAAGSDFAGKIEVPVDILRQSLVVPDEREQASKQGECQQLDPADIGPSLFEVVQSAEAYVGYRNKMTVFDSTGSALEDMVAIETVLDFARDLKLGSRIEIESISRDAKNPYEFLSDVEPFLATNGLPGEMATRHTARTDGLPETSADERQGPT